MLTVWSNRGLFSSKGVKPRNVIDVAGLFLVKCSKNDLVLNKSRLARMTLLGAVWARSLYFAMDLLYGDFTR